MTYDAWLLRCVQVIPRLDTHGYPSLVHQPCHGGTFHFCNLW